MSSLNKVGRTRASDPDILSLASEGDYGVIGTNAETQTAVTGQDGDSGDQGKDDYHADVEISGRVTAKFENGKKRIMPEYRSQHGGKCDQDKLVRRPMEEMVGDQDRCQRQQQTGW